MRNNRCFVPGCENSTINCPDKLFFSVPRTGIRRKWCESVGRQPDSLGNSTHTYCCQDHFNLEEDVEDWRRYIICKKAGLQTFRLALKKGIFPHLNVVKPCPRGDLPLSTPGLEASNVSTLSPKSPVHKKLREMSNESSAPQELLPFYENSNFSAQPYSIKVRPMMREITNTQSSQPRPSTRVDSSLQTPMPNILNFVSCGSINPEHEIVEKINVPSGPQDFEHIQDDFKKPCDWVTLDKPVPDAMNIFSFSQKNQPNKIVTNVYPTDFLEIQCDDDIHRSQSIESHSTSGAPDEPLKKDCGCQVNLLATPVAPTQPLKKNFGCQTMARMTRKKFRSVGVNVAPKVKDAGTNTILIRNKPCVSTNEETDVYESTSSESSAYDDEDDDSSYQPSEGTLTISSSVDSLESEM